MLKSVLIIVSHPTTMDVVDLLNMLSYATNLSGYFICRMSFLFSIIFSIYLTN